LLKVTVHYNREVLRFLQVHLFWPARPPLLSQFWTATIRTLTSTLRLRGQRWVLTTCNQTSEHEAPQITWFVSCTELCIYIATELNLAQQFV